ncbi:Uncharacterized protein Rs2_29045 [Raphanus sativus]|nr:Uncharacterized protein Rs2_29045 [Raphanus sativus]
MVDPAPVIVLSDDDTEPEDVVMEVSEVGPSSPITISSTGTTGETPSYDPAEDHGPLPPTPVGMPSGSPPLEAFELPIPPALLGFPDYSAFLQLEDALWRYFCLPTLAIEGRDDDRNNELVRTYLDMMDIVMTSFPITSETGGPPSIPPMETATVQPPHFHTTYETGGPSTCVPMETAATELPPYQTIYETGGPSRLPAIDTPYVFGGSTSLGDPYAPQSYHHEQGSDVLFGAGDRYVDPHGYPYHTTTHLSGSDLYPTCLACGVAGHLTADCRRYYELSGIPYLPSAQPAGESSEWTYCPNCDMLLYIWRS